MKVDIEMNERNNKQMVKLSVADVKEEHKL